MQKILIVGGGLAGLTMAYQLSEKGCRVTVYESGANASSRVAAGMINPMVFRRMTKSWRLDEFLPFARNFYRQLEEDLTISVLHEIVIRRFFSSEQERNFWLDRQHLPEFSNYLHVVDDLDEKEHPYANEFGSGRVKNSYFVSTNVLLDALINCGKFDVKQEKFDYSALNPEAGDYKNETFDTVVFCEGYQSKENPWFSYLPVDATKGETLTVQTDGLSNNESYNRKCFSLPLGENKFRVGATYVWHTANTELTEAGKNQLLDNLTYLTNEPVEVVEHMAGIRPTTRDRRPFMGRHPQFSKLAVFNGLGAKGYMMAPLLAKEMIDFLLNETPVDKECSISRIVLS